MQKCTSLLNLFVKVPDVPPNVDATATICFAKLAAFGETTSDRPKVQLFKVGITINKCHTTGFIGFDTRQPIFCAENVLGLYIRFRLVRPVPVNS